MKKWMIASAILITLSGASGTAFGQPKIAEREPRQVQIDIFVAQVNRAAALQIGLISDNSGGVSSAFVNREQAQQALQRLANLGLAQVVTRPTVLALDGQNAVIQVGGEVAVPVAEPADASSVSFVPTGVCMKVTPAIRDNGQVLLAIDSQISRRSEGSIRLENGAQAPVFDMTSATTRVELNDGQTWMFTQSYACACKENAEQLPLLAYVPVFGRLAGFGELTPENSVYLVLVTPQLIPPAAIKDQFQFDVRICEGDPDGSQEAGTLKILSTPRIVTLDGREFNFNVGGVSTADAEDARELVEFGTRLSILPRSVDDQTVFIDARFENTKPTSASASGVLNLVGKSFRMIGKVKLGEPTRMMLDQRDCKKLWCDVTITKAKPRIVRPLSYAGRSYDITMQMSEVGAEGYLKKKVILKGLSLTT
jgi:type II secretory pathway component GspD/PulD (secretin)